MRFLFFRSPLLAAVTGAFFLCFAGCQTPHSFATPDASWKSHIGQLKHTNNKRTLVGEVVVQQRGAEEFQLDFLKGGSFPLLSLRQDATVTRAEGLLAAGHWQGVPEKAPAALRPWMGLRKFFFTADAPGSEKARGGATPLTFNDGGQHFEFLFQR